MPKTSARRVQPDPQTIYEIRVEGHLGDRWADWFGSLTVALEEDGSTCLTGPVIDQSALYGLLKKVRDLGMPLLLVKRIEPCQAEDSKLEKGEKDEHTSEDS